MELTLQAAKDSLNAYGYTMLQYTGDVPPLTEEELSELDKIAYRLVGFDNMFTTPKFSTISYIIGVEGLKAFFSVDLCKRYVREIREIPMTSSNGVIYTNTTKLEIILNGTNHKINRFKASFIGLGGRDIRELSKHLKCAITLIDNP